MHSLCVRTPKERQLRLLNVLIVEKTKILIDPHILWHLPQLSAHSQHHFDPTMKRDWIYRCNRAVACFDGYDG